ncbi:protein FRA10AC1 homolog [Lucilia cuprina]|uniref:protein FRA10AC1 homolog n=1 Tax=Lucilia cuprina TaxID=7375 RepID=UPI001F06C7E7|nr:protein FRA10AC1 homolog [Lucilia cuprina]
MFPISLKSLSDQERHDYILKTFILNKNYTAEKRKHKRDIDVIREHHRFLWDEDNDNAAEDSWEVRLAKRYYDKLFKEYCIADLSRHKENKVALRWRTEAEVVSGVGQFQCGSRKCLEKEHLRSWEVNFAYQEQGERKNALVKLRLCPEHSEQLNYTSKKREVKRLKHMERQQIKEAKREKRKSLKNKKTHTTESDKDVDGEELQSEEGNNVMEDVTEKHNDELEDCTRLNKSKAEDDEIQAASEDVWNKKPDIEVEPVSRESEFERYLEDLLL